MAAIGAALVGKVLGHSAAEKAFRPWWDTLEDSLIYGLVMLGIILVPTAIITGTPLDCNFCQADHCSSSGKEFVNKKEDPGFNAWWVKKFCTMNGSVEPFMLYFPYFLLLIAMALVMIERVFERAFKAGSKLEKFYSLLVRENILGSELNTDTKGLCIRPCDVVDGGREAIELRQSFRGKRTYFLSYLLRTILEVIVASILLVYMCWRGLPILDDANTIICDVHSYYFECSGQPAQFYVYSLYITCIITIAYILCNIYNLLWLIFPCFGKLSRMMSTYKANMRDRAGDSTKTDKQLLGDLYDIYYNNRDLRLLLDLLATSSGVAPAIAIMTLFDKNFRDAMKPKIKYVVVSRDLGIAEVQFQEPKTGVRAALGSIHGVRLMYVAEIVPPAETAVEAFESKYIPEEGELEDDIEMAPLRGFIERACFHGLKPDVHYTMKISTVVNGKTICHVLEDIEDCHEKLPEDTEDYHKKLPEDTDTSNGGSVDLVKQQRQVKLQWLQSQGTIDL
eukprot:GFUD01026868.1.p1 GENE.GFUD01026868.1~~GFUD01026868.1.p1  ORF type:complete len:507 (+),score=114.41 GFUD01026868.1:221-1741(+)